MHKNMLLCYEGGGYDGCFWECNFAFWDHNGVFRDIYSSGHNGLFGETKTWDPETMALKWLETGCDNPELFDLNDSRQLETFGTGYAMPHVKAVIQHLIDFYRGIEDSDLKTGDAPHLFCVCSECGAKCEPRDAKLEHWHGCGGLMQTADALVCPKCWVYCGAAIKSQTITGLCNTCEDELRCNNAEIDEILTTIEKDGDRLITLCRLKPQYAKKYKAQFERGKAALVARIRAM